MAGTLLVPAWYQILKLPVELWLDFLRKLTWGVAGGGRISWTFSLLVAATMIAALGAEEAGSKDNEGSVALVQKGSSEGCFLWPQIKAAFHVRGNT